ncbi:hypothetical protein [Tenuifilum thalassicum]|nr:hypothetical protein [Tenuifilum thalassicum]
MKTYFRIFATFLLGATMLFVSCEKNEELTKPYDPNDKSLGTTFVINNPNKNVVVNVDTAVTDFTIDILVWGAVPETDVTIPVEIIDSLTTLSNEAYEIVGGSVTVPAGKNSAQLKVKLYRDKFTPGVYYSLGYKLGTPSSGNVYAPNAMGVIQSFNPGPLAPWVGNYSAFAKSYGAPGDWDEDWGEDIQIALDPNDPLNNIVITGIKGKSTALVATIDVQNLTITIQPGQLIGDIYGYGDVAVYLGDADLNLYNAPLVGTVNAETGEIHVDFWGHLLATGDYAGSVWDVFDVTFTPVSK